MQWQPADTSKRNFLLGDGSCTRASSGICRSAMHIRLDLLDASLRPQSLDAQAVIENALRFVSLSTTDAAITQD